MLQCFNMHGLATLLKRTRPEVQGINTLFKTQTCELYTLFKTGIPEKHTVSSGTSRIANIGEYPPGWFSVHPQPFADTVHVGCEINPIDLRLISGLRLVWRLKGSFPSVPFLPSLPPFHFHTPLSYNCQSQGPVTSTHKESVNKFYPGGVSPLVLLTLAT